MIHLCRRKSLLPRAAMCFTRNRNQNSKQHGTYGVCSVVTVFYTHTQFRVSSSYAAFIIAFSQAIIPQIIVLFFGTISAALGGASAARYFRQYVVPDTFSQAKSTWELINALLYYSATCRSTKPFRPQFMTNQ